MTADGAMTADGLVLDSVTVRFGDRIALDAIDMTLPASDQSGMSPVTALLGPSGCGKSTLIRVIAGLETPTAGSISIDGLNLIPIPVHRRDFGVVFQDGQLFTGRSVADNVAYGLRMRRWSRADIETRVNDVLRLVKMVGRKDDPVHVLSGGQAQRVALARALAPRPRLLLLDEPLSALDRRLRDDLADDLADIVRTSRTPTLMVTHDHAEAAVIAERIAVMNDGRIHQVAATDELWQHPSDEWVAGFLGARLAITARISGGVAHTVFGSVPVNACDGTRRLGLRPEALVAEPAETPDTGITVVRRTALPGHWRLRLSIRQPVARIPGPDTTSDVVAICHRAVEVGAQVRLRLDPAQVAVIG